MNRAKTNCKLLTFFCVTLTLTTTLYTAALRACTNGVAKIAGNGRYPPLTWYDDKQLTGLSVEVIRKILNEQSINVELSNPTPWKRLLHQAQKGEIDILLGVRENKQWASFLHYVKPAITPSAQGIFFRADAPLTHKAAEWQHLQHYVGGTLRGASFGKEFDLYAQSHLKLQSANSLDINFLKLLKGRVDYLLAPLLPTQLYVQQAGYQDRIIHNPEPLLVINEYLAIAKTSGCIRYAPIISGQISTMIENETIDHLLEQHFSLWFEKQQAKK